MLTIDEVASERGIETTVLRVHEDELVLEHDGQEVLVPSALLEAIVRRCGAPFDVTETVREVGRIAWEVHTLRHVRHLARFDVIARDYLVYEREGAEALCALAATVAGVLRGVARSTAPSTHNASNV